MNNCLIIMLNIVNLTLKLANKNAESKMKAANGGVSYLM